MAKIIIVGLAPGSSRFNEDTSPTRKRVRKWLGNANYDWTNKSDDDIEHIKKYENGELVPELKSEEIPEQEEGKAHIPVGKTSEKSIKAKYVSKLLSTVLRL